MRSACINMQAKDGTADLALANSMREEMKGDSMNVRPKKEKINRKLSRCQWS